MKDVDLNIWWSSLPVSEKERIATKGPTKASADGKIDESLAHYPGCTNWWGTLDDESKYKIFLHCVSRHGDELKEWDNANPYGD
ncbi:MAG: hypothetical protein J6X63_01900 [Bacteroidales bacterium]|nr:hypothetical protein [Bacteroidales bacterium]